MPDCPDPDKTVLGIRLERSLKRRIESAAKIAGCTITDYVRTCLIAATANVVLTSADYEQIAIDTRKAEARAHRAGNPNRTRTQGKAR